MSTEWLPICSLNCQQVISANIFDPRRSSAPGVHSELESSLDISQSRLLKSNQKEY